MKIVSKLATGPERISFGSRPATRFSQEFKAFLAIAGFQLKDFLPDDYFGEDMFPNCRISRATGYEKLRGQGKLTEKLALLWARRSNLFLEKGVEKAQKQGKQLCFDGISFVDYEVGQPKINWQKLISIYESEALAPLSIEVSESIDDVKLAALLNAIRGVVGDIEIVVARVKERSIEFTILVPSQSLDEIIARFAEQGAGEAIIDVKEASAPASGSLSHKLWLDGPPIDLGQLDALDRFRRAWTKAIWIESAARPWRRLRWLTSPSIRSSPLASVISDSHNRTYAADHSGHWGALKADVLMASVTWPAFAALTLTLGLLALHTVVPFVAIDAGVATGLALSLIGSQVCSCALSPIACGAGTIVMCWAFGLAHAVLIGAFGHSESFSRSNVQHDFFISITGGIVGLSAPNWLSRIPTPLVVLLLLAIASAIAATGWFMAQPINAANVAPISRRRLAIGTIAGSGMGAGIGLVRLVSTTFKHLGCPQHIAVMGAFALVGTATFVLAIRLRVPQIRMSRLAALAFSYVCIACLLFAFSYRPVRNRFDYRLPMRR